MPQWLSNQLQRAFQSKDRKQIRLLNDCWFFYQTNFSTEKDLLKEVSKLRQ